VTVYQTISLSSVFILSAMGTPILLTARAPLHVRFMLIVISTSESKQHQHSDSKDNEKGRARSSVAQGSSTPTAIPLNFIAGFARACLIHSIHVDNRYDAPANHEVVLSAHCCHNVMDGNETSMKILEKAYKVNLCLAGYPPCHEMGKLIRGAARNSYKYEAALAPASRSSWYRS
jgi:hypothetical protein